MSEPAGVYDAWQLQEAVNRGPYWQELRAAESACDEARAEAERLREALDQCDRATYGWSFATAVKVIDNVRLIARAAALSTPDTPGGDRKETR